MESLIKIFELAKQKLKQDIRNGVQRDWNIYFDWIKDEIDEIEAEIKPNNHILLEDELTDMLWIYISLLEELDQKGYINKESVFRKCLDKFTERCPYIATGEETSVESDLAIWNKVKKEQKQRNIAMHERYYGQIWYNTTLVMIEESPWNFIMGTAKRGISEGKINSAGGKANRWESIEDCAVREVQEELGIIIQKEDLKKVGYLRFYFDNTEIDDHDTTVYWVKKYQGEPQETDEMKPVIIHKDNMPYDKMWADDATWLPRVLDGQYVEYDVYFDENTKMRKCKKIK